MSFSYDAGFGANENVSFIDLPPMRVMENKVTDETVSINLSELSEEDLNTDRPLFNAGLEPDVEKKSTLKKKISLRKDLVNNVASKGLEEIERMLKKRVT